MKILTAAQIRAGDAYTIRHEPIDSIALMERAAKQCAHWLEQKFAADCPFYIFCGTGNNGGDGLALTRLLHDAGREAMAYMLPYSDRISPDCRTNQTRLEHAYGAKLRAIHRTADFPALPENAVLVDALFGTGLNRPLEGLPAELVRQINKTTRPVVAIDIPSGLQAEENPADPVVVQADHTLSFEGYKLAFLFPENATYTGQIHLLPIGIHPDYIRQTDSPYLLVQPEDIHRQLIRRNAFSHKGTYGHVLIVAGSRGKTGAAVLATKTAVHSGAGLVTAYVPADAYDILQTTVPEAMCCCDPEAHYLTTFEPALKQYDAVGLGPGIGMAQETADFLRKALEHLSAPLVLDADALNLLGKEPALLSRLGPQTILTPHPKEFERLFGPTANAFERLQLQMQQSQRLQVTIVLKGHHSCVTTPSGEAWFNTTGNAGMATGGSGDVLTGLLAGLLAQGYPAPIAAVLGVWLHGKAGDLALENDSMESLSASGLIDFLGAAFKSGHKM